MPKRVKVKKYFYQKFMECTVFQWKEKFNFIGWGSKNESVSALSLVKGLSDALRTRAGIRQHN
jgi:hypothetical protein